MKPNDLNAVLGFLLFAQITESFNVFLIDKQGRVNELNKPIHIDAELTPKNIRERLQEQFEEFLRKRKKLHHVEVKKLHNKKILSNDLRNVSSPVVYSNGRYTLDLDKFEVKDVTEVTSPPQKEVYYFDPAESFRDYYDFINFKDLFKVKNGKVSDNEKSKKDDSLRKKNNLVIGGKIIRSGNPKSDIVLRSKKKKKRIKRFQVIHNDKRKRKRKKKEYSPKYVSHEDLATSNLFFEELSAEDHKKSSEESDESEEGVYYMQANQLVTLKPKASGKDNDDWSDGRRRLPHFMPKRFHWHPREIKRLGYFWFNGPRGKYPEATPLN